MFDKDQDGYISPNEVEYFDPLSFFTMAINLNVKLSTKEKGIQNVTITRVSLY